MICDECGRDNAVYKLVVFISGQRTQRNLCPECMEKQKQNQAGEMKNLLNMLFQEVNQPQGENASNPKGEKEKPKDITCPRCGTSLSQVKKGVRLGCSTCYKAFRSDLGQFLTRMNGGAQHTGRTPAQAGVKGEKERREEALKNEMALAVACEDYERAAEIRDELKKTAESLPLEQEKGEGVHA